MPSSPTATDCGSGRKADCSATRERKLRSPALRLEPVALSRGASGAVYNAEVSGQRSRSYLLEDARQRTAEAERLDLQARVLFPLERVALAEHGVGAGQTLLDLGCGQGTFLSQMAQAFGGMRCFGLDRNPGLLAEARSRPGIADVALCDVADPPALLQQLERHHPDLIFSRFVLQHMSAGE